MFFPSAVVDTCRKLQKPAGDVTKRSRFACLLLLTDRNNLLVQHFIQKTDVCDNKRCKKQTKIILTSHLVQFTSVNLTFLNNIRIILFQEFSGIKRHFCAPSFSKGEHTPESHLETRTSPSHWSVGGRMTQHKVKLPKLLFCSVNFLLTVFTP